MARLQDPRADRGGDPPRGASVELIASTLRCPECGGGLAPREDLLECSDGHARLRVDSAEGFWASSIVWLADVEGSVGPLVVKLPKPVNRRPEETRPRGEAAVLRELQERFSSGPYRVPVIVPTATSDGAIAMRPVEGSLLETRLAGRDAWLAPGAVADAFERAGRWLGRLVASTTVDEVPFRAPEILARADRFLAEAVEEGYPDARARELAALAREEARHADGALLRRCLVHDDFRPSHAYAGPATLTVIDFEQAAEGWAHEDASFFLAGLEIFAARHPLARLSPAYRAAAGRFLAGYRVEAGAGWAETGRFLRLAAMIRALAMEHRSELARERPLLFERVVLPRYERWFRSAATRR